MKETKKDIINKVTTHALRLAIVVLGGIVLALCVFALPSMWQAIPAEYPTYSYTFYAIITALYISAIPFFYALRQALLLLRYIDKNTAFSNSSVRSLKKISFCGIVIGLIFTAVMPFIYIWAENDDAPGLILFWSLFIGASFTVAIFAGVMERVLKQAIALKKENDLTV